MLRRIFLTIFFAVTLLSVSTVSVFAKSICVILEAQKGYTNTVEVWTLMDNKAKELFPTLTVIPFSTAEQAVRTYREDTHMVFNQYYFTPLGRGDIKDIAIKDLKADYVLVMNVEHLSPNVNSGLFSVSFKTPITTNVRLYSVEQENFLANALVNTATSDVYRGMPSTSIYFQAIKKAFESLKVNPVWVP